MRESRKENQECMNLKEMIDMSPDGMMYWIEKILDMTSHGEFKTRLSSIEY